MAYESLLEGATGISFLDVDDSGGAALALSIDPEQPHGPHEHAGRGRTAGPHRARRRRRLQGGPVQHRRDRAGPRRRVLRGAGRRPRGAAAACRSRCRSRSWPAPSAARCTGSSRAPSRRSPAPTRSSSTIMLNSLAAFAIVGLVNDIFKITGPTFARTGGCRQRRVADPLRTRRQSRRLHRVRDGRRSPTVLIYRTTLGFEIRTVGANPSAARYAGMSPRRLIVLTMSLCGLFAGLAGAIEILSLGYYPAIFGTTIGFAGITVALLGRAHPVGIAPRRAAARRHARRRAGDADRRPTSRSRSSTSSRA